MREHRTKIWIDHFQTYMVLRVALYFGLYQFAVWAWLLMERTMSSNLAEVFGEETASTFSLFAVLAGVLMGLVFIYDAVQFAHRIVGPLVRFRKTMKAIAEGEEVDLVRLRQGDFLQELRDECNEMLKTLEQRGAIVLKDTAAKQDQNQPVSA